MPSLDKRVFRAVSNTPNGEVGDATRFHYRQQDDVVTATYSGGGIRHGQLLAHRLPDGALDMRYHHLNEAGQFRIGQCRTTIEVLADGRLRLHEVWQWLDGDQSSGTSLVEEVAA